MAAFYAAMHQIVGELIYADNFFIALYDAGRQRINFPFYLDEVDTDIPTRISGSRSVKATRQERLPTSCATAALCYSLITG